MKKFICPSILAADFKNLENDILESVKGGADIIHCDIMDGQFVPNISFGPDLVSLVNQITDVPLDVHLMINNPENFIGKFAKAGADYISVHIENNNHLHRLINQIKDEGCKAGIVLNPATNVFSLEEIITYVDFILIMSVNPGFGGQKFIPSSLDKVKKTKKLILKNNSDCLIEIDGGVGMDNIKNLSDSGVDMFVCGASIFKSGNISKTTSELKKLIS
ncbi:MAG TPA: ribulose-phosphate 3-epimerase [Ignavibacteria bacterium]|nr:ribulose-phosphate 3-epimerase [Ignavibacteria bacterium]